MVLRAGKLLMQPGQAVAEAKKRPSYGDALGTLILSAILAGIAAGVAVAVGGGQLMAMAAGAAIGAFVLVLLGGLFVGLVLKLIVVTLGGKGKYIQGLTAVAYTAFVPSAGLLVAAIFTVIPVVSAVIGFLAVALATGLGVATLYRSIKELFGTDMITALVAVGVLVIAIAAGFWAGALSLAGSQIFSLPGLMGMPAA